MCDGQAHVRSASRFQGVVQPFVGDHCVKQIADIIIRIEYTHDLSGMTVAEVPSTALQLQPPNMVLQCVCVFTVSM